MPSEINYRAAEGLSGSRLTALYEAPRKFWYQEENPIEVTDGMIKGSLAHLFTLEPEEWESEQNPYFTLDPDKKWAKNTKEGKANWAELEANTDLSNYTVVKQEWVDEAKAMAEIARNQYNFSKKLINDPESVVEEPLYWEELGAACKGKPDLYNKALNILVDYKTTADCDPKSNKFYYKVMDMGYLLQMAHYQEGLKRKYGLDQYPGLMIVAQEQKAPYMMQAFEIKQEDINKAHELRKKILVDYAEGLAFEDKGSVSYSDELVVLERKSK